jgi:glycerophosphoryl diester phosphodiesterase
MKNSFVPKKNYFFSLCFLLKSLIGFSQNPNSVIAHRGAWKAYDLPENSIASLKQAIVLNCKGSEFDVHMTADGVLVVNHDAKYHDLEIEKSTYKQLSAYSLSNGEQLPRLKEYLKAGKNKNTRLVCEIKPASNTKRGRMVAQKVVALVEKLKVKEIVDYISFDYDILLKIRSLDPMAHLQYLTGNKSPVELKKDKIDGLDYHFSVFKNRPEWIEDAKVLGLSLNTWTVNETKDLDWFIANNFDFITTNEPERAFERIKISPLQSNWKLVWSDEFNKDGLPDDKKWGYDVGGHGWGNNELQFYTERDKNTAFVQNGIMTISANRQKTENKDYASARLVTKNHGDWLYGKIEVRAKLPKGKGTWPAIWMLPTDWEFGGWPESGEIDIMEHVGYEPDTVYGTVHTKAFNHSIGTHKTGSFFIDTPYSEFHDYGIEWDQEKIDFLYEGKKYFSFKNTKKNFQEWPFDKRFHLILNIAVGGNWGGKYGVAEDIFPAKMEIDYVRVFQK